MSIDDAQVAAILAFEEARRLCAGLTPRQLDVLVLCAQGLGMKEIGAAVGLSVQGVRERQNVIRRRLQVETMIEAAVIATRAGLV